MLWPSGGCRKIWYMSSNVFEFKLQVSRSFELLGMSLFVPLVVC
jgi:hypothetical protein